MNEKFKYGQAGFILAFIASSLTTLSIALKSSLVVS